MLMLEFKGAAYLRLLTSLSSVDSPLVNYCKLRVEQSRLHDDWTWHEAAWSRLSAEVKHWSIFAKSHRQTSDDDIQRTVWSDKAIRTTQRRRSSDRWRWREVSASKRSHVPRGPSSQIARVPVTRFANRVSPRYTHIEHKLRNCAVICAW